MKRSWIETFSESLGLIPKISDRPDWSEEDKIEGSKELYKYPDPNEWDDFKELDAKAWPEKKMRHYSIVPTTCFNCESACGLLAYIDKDSDRVEKFEGNPHHPGSRGRNCAKGPATINQINENLINTKSTQPDSNQRPSENKYHLQSDALPLSYEWLKTNTHIHS